MKIKHLACNVHSNGTEFCVAIIVLIIVKDKEQW